ncbi:MAG: Gfo/Idh/MocA family oxidoreductase [Bryobacterales bacterium]|nr:Gfo/Idh/MocA family oxidoreductase [Bryobacterales bacterium]
MDSRRKFIGAVATGLASTLASSTGVLGANDRLRIGIIGAGQRGIELVHQALACPNVEIGGFADVYSKRLDDARNLVPSAALHRDYRRLLDDRSIDAVIIATPQHLHGEHFVHSLEAGKHVYQEKTMAFTLEQAKRMRTAHRQASKAVVQIGHQSCSSGQMRDAINFLSTGYAGKITAIRMHWYRNTPHGKAQWARPVYPDMTPENIAWNSFLGEAPSREFEPHRFANWRLFEDYSGGNVCENLSQQLAFWYRALNLQIPQAATMTGGLYLWKDGRDVPDTMNVTFEQPEQMLVSWDSGLGNSQLGITEDVLGSDGTISRNSSGIRYIPQKVNRPEGTEIAGKVVSFPTAHMQNFIDCIRTGQEPVCPFELGYRVSIACRMALDSFHLGRTVYWDPRTETIA